MDLSQIKFGKLSTAIEMLNTGVCTINEIRKYLGLPPVPHGEEIAERA